MVQLFILIEIYLLVIVLEHVTLPPDLSTEEFEIQMLLKTCNEEILYCRGMCIRMLLGFHLESKIYFSIKSHSFT